MRIEAKIKCDVCGREARDTSKDEMAWFLLESSTRRESWTTFWRWDASWQERVKEGWFSKRIRRMPEILDVCRACQQEAMELLFAKRRDDGRDLPGL